MEGAYKQGVEMTHKWVNVVLDSGQLVVIRNCERSNRGDFIVYDDGRTEYEFNIDKVQYIRTGKSEDME